MVTKPVDKDEVWGIIQQISDIRAGFNLFDSKQKPKYSACSAAIKYLRLLIGADKDAPKIIVVPEWCKVGMWIEWHAPKTTGLDWVNNKIIGYGVDGFYHTCHGCHSIYFSKFTDLGDTIRIPEKK